MIKCHGTYRLDMVVCTDLNWVYFLVAAFLKNLKLGCTIISIGFYGVRVQLCAVLANHFLIEDQLLIRQQMNQRIFYKIS